jgi:CDP-diacylglycerol--serine O-phosphatidyltransferase
MIVAFLVSFPFATMTVLTFVYLAALPLSWRSYQNHVQNGRGQAAPDAAASEVRGVR